MNVVDTHAHVFVRGLQLAEVRRYAPDYDATVDAYLEQLDRHAVTHGVLVQPSFLGNDNTFMLTALRANRSRLRGICVVEPDLPGETLALMAKQGVVGIRLNLMGAQIPQVNTGPWPRFLHDLAALELQVEVHCNACDLPQIVGSLVNAGVNVVVDHFGRPDPGLGVRDPGFQYLLSVGATRKVWVKLSAAYRNGADGIGARIADDAVPLLMHKFGPERLLWGSDWPHTQFEPALNYKTARTELDRWLPDHQQRSAILDTTPMQLFRF